MVAQLQNSENPGRCSVEEGRAWCFDTVTQEGVPVAQRPVTTLQRRRWLSGEAGGEAQVVSGPCGNMKGEFL